MKNEFTFVQLITSSNIPLEFSFFNSKETTSEYLNFNGNSETYYIIIPLEEL